MHFPRGTDCNGIRETFHNVRLVDVSWTNLAAVNFSCANECVVVKIHGEEKWGVYTCIDPSRRTHLRRVSPGVGEPSLTGPAPF